MGSKKEENQLQVDKNMEDKSKSQLKAKDKENLAVKEKTKAQENLTVKVKPKTEESLTIKKSKFEEQEENKNTDNFEGQEENNNPENTESQEMDKVKDIVKKAKENGKITYGELAKELENTNPDQIDKVFDAFEEMGVSLNDDLDEEPDIEDLKEVEDLKLDEITDTSYEGINVDDPVRMYLREIGRIPSSFNI